jgi:hypothetical protein
VSIHKRNGFPPTPATCRAFMNDRPEEMMPLV